MRRQFPFLAGALVVVLWALPASAQVIDFVDHFDAAGHVGEVAVVTGPVARVDRLGDGTLHLALGLSYAKRTVEVFIPPSLARLFGNGDLFEHMGVQVRGTIELDSARAKVPFVVLAEDGRVQVVERSSVNLAPPPRIDAEAATLPKGPNPWTLTVSPGVPLGGPVGQMEAKLLEGGWTEEYCDFKKTSCHTNPLIRRPVVAITGTLSRRFSRMVQGNALFSLVPLGSAEGRHNGTDVRADWSTILFGGTVGISPIRQLYLGAGPVFAMLNSARVDNQPRGVLRPGAMVEGAIRSSPKRSMFLELAGSYRYLPKRLEGPWPGRKDAAFVAAGPGTMEANFSHAFVSIGVGMRFASGTQ